MTKPATSTDPGPATRRIGWGWWLVGGVLALWLVVLLVTAGPRRPESPLEQKAPDLKPFDRTTADAFSKRRDVRSSTRAVPRVDDTQGQ